MRDWVRYIRDRDLGGYFLIEVFLSHGPDRFEKLKSLVLPADNFDEQLMYRYGLEDADMDYLWEQFTENSDTSHAIPFGEQTEDGGYFLDIYALYKDEIEDAVLNTQSAPGWPQHQDCEHYIRAIEELGFHVDINLEQSYVEIKELETNDEPIHEDFGESIDVKDALERLWHRLAIAREKGYV